MKDMVKAEIERHGNVAVLRLNNGVTNPIDLDFVNLISDVLLDVKKDEKVTSLVLASGNDKFFSIGFNIPELYDLERKDFGTFYRAFNKLSLDIYTFPKPTIAALTGHAIAGGCVLAICCDHRIIADGRKLMGVNEVKLGVPVPYPAYVMLEQLVGPRNAYKISSTGDFFEPEKALELGMVDNVLPVNEVMKAALEKVGSLGAMPRNAFEVIKQNSVEDVSAKITEREDEMERKFIDCWYSDGTRALLKEAMKKF
jgi:enoyl-CoA hydratase/carnithine racemase